MTTVLQGPGTVPTWPRKCDAGCYDSSGSTCQCVCGGMNHGAGYKQAVKNTKKKYRKEWGSGPWATIRYS